MCYIKKSHINTAMKYIGGYVGDIWKYIFFAV